VTICLPSTSHPCRVRGSLLPIRPSLLLQRHRQHPRSRPRRSGSKNAVAEFAGIDKITGRIITFDVYVDETVQFGALQVTPRVCYSRPRTKSRKTDSFVEVDEITLDRKIRRIFTGWMFAESPASTPSSTPSMTSG
jgi:hypothetical protein